MRLSWRRTAFLMICAFPAAGCQPELHSDLPAGPAAYRAVAVTDADTVSALTLLQPKDQISVNVFKEEDLTTPDVVIDEAENAKRDQKQGKQKPCHASRLAAFRARGCAAPRPAFNQRRWRRQSKSPIPRQQALRTPRDRPPRLPCARQDNPGFRQACRALPPMLRRRRSVAI